VVDEMDASWSGIVKVDLGVVKVDLGVAMVDIDG
jgi:hypothetical protein